MYILISKTIIYIYIYSVREREGGGREEEPFLLRKWEDIMSAIAFEMDG